MRVPPFTRFGTQLPCHVTHKATAFETASSQSRLPRRIAFKNLWLGGLVMLLLVAASVLLMNEEIRSFVEFNVVLAYARDAHFLRLVNKDATGKEETLYLLGTIHRDHLDCEAYSLRHIQAVVRNLKPDLLLVESRPEELTKGNWGDGPIEMPVASLTAISLQIPVQGIDWWRRAGSSPGTSSPEREDRIYQNVLQRLPGHEKVLILVGYSHVAELRNRLRADGYALAAFDRQEKLDLFRLPPDAPTFPPGLRRTIQKRIDDLMSERDRETDSAWRTAIEANVAVRRRLLGQIEKSDERRDP